MTKRKIFLTGPPRCGKSTLIKRIVDRLDVPKVGFITEEIREKGMRVGFSIKTMDGEAGVLAHQAVNSGIRVGKYGVCLEDIERIAVPSMMPRTPNDLVVIDEIGKMECCCLTFKKALFNILSKHNVVLASIALKGGSFIEGIKKRSDVTVLHVTKKNRSSLVEIVLRAFGTPEMTQDGNFH